MGQLDPGKRRLFSDDPILFCRLDVSRGEKRRGGELCLHVSITPRIMIIQTQSHYHDTVTGFLLLFAYM